MKRLVVVLLTLLTTITMARGADLKKDSTPSHMTFRLDGDTVYAYGPLEAGTMPAFRELRDRYSLEGKTIELDSPGGIASIGMELGREIRKLHMNTKIGPFGLCESMCPFVFAAGVNRSVLPSSRLTVHQPYLMQKSFPSPNSRYRGIEVTGLMMEVSLLSEYIYEMGVSVELLEIALMTPPWKRLHQLSKTELISTRLIN